MTEDIAPTPDEIPTADQHAKAGGEKVAGEAGIPWGLGSFLAVAVLLVVFAVQNTQDVDLRFLGWEGRFPLVVIIVTVVVVTVVLDEILGTVLRRRRARRRAEREELKRLRSQRG
ncbi:MAG TPA: lipopolysaccharide assembly protein LapA domain-containing protein [Acidimicrobiia bacterium]